MLATTTFLDENRLAELECEDMLLPHNITKNHHLVIGGVEHVFLTENDLEELPGASHSCLSPEEILEVKETFQLQDDYEHTKRKSQLSVLDYLFDTMTSTQARIIRMYFIQEKSVDDICKILAQMPNHERFTPQDVELSIKCSLEQMRFESDKIDVREVIFQ